MNSIFETKNEYTSDNASQLWDQDVYHTTGATVWGLLWVIESILTKSKNETQTERKCNLLQLN